MKVLVTEAKSFVGRNLCARLRSIRDEEARSYGIGGKDSSATPQNDSLTIESVSALAHGKNGAILV